MYAWIIDRDHLAEEEMKITGRVEDDEKGTTGPSNAPDEWCAWLIATEGVGNVTLGGVMLDTYRFTMCDDDKILYYTGRMITDERDSVSDEACYGPLGDFGAPNAGCIEITYPGHKDMDCG